MFRFTTLVLSLILSLNLIACNGDRRSEGGAFFVERIHFNILGVTQGILDDTWRVPLFATSGIRASNLEGRPTWVRAVGLDGQENRQIHFGSGQQNVTWTFQQPLEDGRWRFDGSFDGENYEEGLTIRVLPRRYDFFKFAEFKPHDDRWLLLKMRDVQFPNGNHNPSGDAVILSPSLLQPMRVELTPGGVLVPFDLTFSPTKFWVYADLDNGHRSPVHEFVIGGSDCSAGVVWEDGLFSPGETVRLNIIASGGMFDVTGGDVEFHLIGQTPIPEEIQPREGPAQPPYVDFTIPSAGSWRVRLLAQGPCSSNIVEALEVAFPVLP